MWPMYEKLNEEINKVARPTWQEMYFEIAKVVAKRSEDPHTKVGAVIVKNGVVVGTGYNGAPRNYRGKFNWNSEEKYDYVILDTAPVGLVADTLIIARVADASVYICRADYTAKSDLELVNTLYAEKKLKNLSIVLNGVDMTKRKYGYYYGYGSYGRYGKYRHGQYGQYGYSPEISRKS